MSVETSFSFSTSISVATNFSFVSLLISSDVEDAVLLAAVDDEAEKVVEEEELDGEVVTILYNTGEQRTAVEGSSRPAREMAGTLS